MTDVTKRAEREGNMMKQKVKRILMIFLLMISGLFVAGRIFVIVQIFKAPKLSEINAAPEGYLTTILDREEQIVDTLYVTESNRIHVELEQIPLNLQEAFIAIEDARFYSHYGVDVKGMLRAFVTGVKNGNFTQGASTITQQLLKNNVFTDWMSEKDFWDKLGRKVQEQYLAICLEQKYSKEWILENYLNTINLGGGTRGVQVASQYYFGKDVSELSLAECALIAGITKNPTAYNPFRYPEKSLERQKLVLNAMLKEEYISSEEYEMAVSENVLEHLITDSSQRDAKVFSWFEDALLQQVAADLMEVYGYNEDEAWNLIYSGGLTIYSTQDHKVQGICEEQARYSPWLTENQQISIVMTDTKTGAVVALVGGSEEKTVSLSYNRATDSIRQPGSTIKVIGEYAAAIDIGKVSLGTVLADEPYEYSDGTKIHNSYTTYKGFLTIRDAISSSSNVVALKTYQMTGEEQVFQYLQKFGITTLTEEDKNESLSIGGTYHGVTNLEMTAAYNAIANNGIYVKPFFYTKVADRDGNILLENKEEGTQIISKETAELLTSAMQDVLERGTGTNAAIKGRTLAGKSGTTNQNKDVWFVGFSSEYTCGIWGGYDNYAEQESSAYVKKLWKDVMEEAHEGKENQPLVDDSLLAEVLICTKSGKLAVKGLCDHTLQGNMTRMEYYTLSGKPTEKCDCHVKVTICEKSGMKAGSFCPGKTKEEQVYLKTGIAGTADESFVLPENLEKKCDEHKYFWDYFFG